MKWREIMSKKKVEKELERNGKEIVEIFRTMVKYGKKK